MDTLTDANFLVYCAKKYNNPCMISSEEFLEDLERIKYIKKLITRYVETKELKERLILNHIITLHNCFGKYTAKILYLKTKKQFQYVKPFLLLIDALPAIIHNVGDEKEVITDMISMDQNIIQSLRKITNGQS